MKTHLFFQIFLIAKTSFFIMILLFCYCNSYLVFPFKIKNPTIKLNNNLITASEYIKYINYNQISTNIYIGTPAKEIEIYLTMDHYDFVLGKGYCLSNPNSQYDPSTSTSYIRTSTSFTSPLYTNGSLSKDNFIFYNQLDLSKSISVNEVEFTYAIASPDFYDLIEPESNCGYLGLQLNSASIYFEWYSLIYQLKFLDIIKSKEWSIIFYEDNEKNEKIKDYDGEFVLGLKDDDFQNIFNINITDYTAIYSVPYIMETTKWEIKFDEIYYKINNENISFFSDIQGQLLIDNNYIICNKYYFNSIKTNFFDKYINEGICYIDKNETLKRTKKTDIRLLNVIICDKNKFKDMNKFPSLYFKHRDINKIFEFNYKDLFQEIGNSIVFSVVFDEEDTYHWVFGRMFLRKYQFIFNNDQKTIRYIKKNNTNNNDNIDDDKNNKENNESNSITITVLKIMLIVFLLVGFGLGLFFGKKIWDKNRKKKANELDEDYEYVESKDKKEENQVGLFSDK